MVAGLDPETVLVGHSGAGAVVQGVADLMPERLQRVVYVDSETPPAGADLRPGLDPTVEEIPLPSWSELEAGGSSLLGLDEAMLAEFRERAVPHPAGPARDPTRLVNPARRQVPVTMVTTSYRASDVQRLAAEGHPFFAELPNLRVDYFDLPTGHRPMWSRPRDLAAAAAEAAAAAV